MYLLNHLTSPPGALPLFTYKENDTGIVLHEYFDWLYSYNLPKNFDFLPSYIIQKGLAIKQPEIINSPDADFEVNGINVRIFDLKILSHYSITRRKPTGKPNELCIFFELPSENPEKLDFWKFWVEPSFWLKNIDLNNFSKKSLEVLKCQSKSFEQLKNCIIFPL